MNLPKSYTEPHDSPISILSDIDESLTYSYANYLSWLFEDRVELIKGKIFPMSGSSRLHQIVSGYIFNSI